jgi:hypothetical protein
MQRRLAILTIGSVLLTGSLPAQDDDAVQRWGKATGDRLLHFLPNASPWGMTVDPYPPFSSFANETYQYRGADSQVRRYFSYIVHQSWFFDDSELSRQLADLQREQAALKQELDRASDEFVRVHGAEMKAFEKAHLAEMNALGSQIADLTRQGKYDEAQAVMNKVAKPEAVVYPPYQALTESFDKRQNDIADRERTLESRRRSVSFQIHTNRTPTTTAPRFAPKPSGTLAGHPFYRQDEESSKAGDSGSSIVDLAVFLAPPGYENPRVKIEHRELAVKSIVVWAWVVSHPDRIKADEAAARKILESIDYDGLVKLIEP